MQKIVVPATEAEFEKDYLTPTYDYYEDDHEEGAPVAPSDDLVPTPDKEANYLNMEVMLPHSVKLVRGWMTEHKCDHEERCTIDSQ